MLSAVLLLAACSRDGESVDAPASEASAALVVPHNWKEVRSEAQAFSLTLPDGFILVAEEPGNDVVLSQQDEHAFMRIQLFDDDAQAADYLQRNTPLMLAAVNEGAVEKLDAPPLVMTAAHDVSAWRVTHAQGNVLAMIFRQNHHWVRLVVFNHGDSEAVFLPIAASLRCHGKGAGTDDDRMPIFNGGSVPQ